MGLTIRAAGTGAHSCWPQSRRRPIHAACSTPRAPRLFRPALLTGTYGMQTRSWALLSLLFKKAFAESQKGDWGPSSTNPVLPRPSAWTDDPRAPGSPPQACSVPISQQRPEPGPRALSSPPHCQIPDIPTLPLPPNPQPLPSAPPLYPTAQLSARHPCGSCGTSSKLLPSHLALAPQGSHRTLLGHTPDHITLLRQTLWGMPCPLDEPTLLRWALGPRGHPGLSPAPTLPHAPLSSHTQLWAHAPPGS